MTDSTNTTAPRLLVVPGLHDSPPEHWQSWLQDAHTGAVRVVQRDWATADVDRWAARVGSALERAGPGPWIAVAHSFGVLALLRHMQQRPDAAPAAALLVAMADPDRFGVAELLPRGRLPMPATLLVSSNDPWLPLHVGQRWAQRWQCPCVNLGNAGHVNVSSGHRTLPYARHWVQGQAQRLAAGRAAGRSASLVLAAAGD
jgi:predicted alpha/beta hydrolase family esterase